MGSKLALHVHVYMYMYMKFGGSINKNKCNCTDQPGGGRGTNLYKEGKNPPAPPPKLILVHLTICVSSLQSMCWSIWRWPRPLSAGSLRWRRGRRRSASVRRSRESSASSSGMQQTSCLPSESSRSLSNPSAKKRYADKHVYYRIHVT